MGRAVAVVLVILIAVGALGWYWQRESARHPGPTTIVQQPLPVPGPQGQPIVRNEPTPAGDGSVPTRIPLPATLDGSDPDVRLAAQGLAPRLAQWLTPEEQIRKWVALVDAVADGNLPERNLPLKFSMPPFRVTATDPSQSDSLSYGNPANFERANVLIETLVAIPPRRLAEYYRAYSPLLERAYAELGRGGSFDARLNIALAGLIAVKPPPGDVPLARPKFYYVYADPALEQSSAVAKLLWRLGPANQRQIQNYLTELAPLL